MSQWIFDDDSRSGTLSHLLRPPVPRSPFHHSTPLHASRAKTINGSQLITFVRACGPTQLQTCLVVYLFDGQTTHQVLRTTIGRTIVSQDPIFMWWLQKNCRKISLSLVVSCYLIANLIRSMTISTRLDFSGNLTDDGYRTYIVLCSHYFHFPAQFNAYPVSCFRGDFSYSITST